MPTTFDAGVFIGIVTKGVGVAAAVGEYVGVSASVGAAFGVDVDSGASVDVGVGMGRTHAVNKRPIKNTAIAKNGDWSVLFPLMSADYNPRRSHYQYVLDTLWELGAAVSGGISTGLTWAASPRTKRYVVIKSTKTARTLVYVVGLKFCGG